MENEPVVMATHNLLRLLKAIALLNDLVVVLQEREVYLRHDQVFIVSGISDQSSFPGSGLGVGGIRECQGVFAGPVFADQKGLAVTVVVQRTVAAAAVVQVVEIK